MKGSRAKIKHIVILMLYQLYLPDLWTWKLCCIWKKTTLLSRDFVRSKTCWIQFHQCTLNSLTQRSQLWCGEYDLTCCFLPNNFWGWSSLGTEIRSWICQFPSNGWEIKSSIFGTLAFHVCWNRVQNLKEYLNSNGSPRHWMRLIIS